MEKLIHVLCLNFILFFVNGVLDTWVWVIFFTFNFFSRSPKNIFFCKIDPDNLIWFVLFCCTSQGDGGCGSGFFFYFCLHKIKPRGMRGNFFRHLRWRVFLCLSLFPFSSQPFRANVLNKLSCKELYPLTWYNGTSAHCL